MQATPPEMHMPTSPLSSPRRRTYALAGLLAFALTLALGGTAFGAVVVSNTTTGFNADATQSPPANNRTEQRSITVNYTAVGPTTWDLDNGLVTGTGSATTFTIPGPLSIGTHKLVIDDGTPTTYIWRIEPPQYKQLVLSDTSLYAYWTLDDAASASLADDSGPNGFDGDYKNFVVKQQAGAPKCEEQPAAPHSPWACDWAAKIAGQGADPAFYGTIDPVTNTPAAGDGRDAKGFSAYFGGRDDHVQIEGMPNPASPEWTAEAWVKPDFSEQTRGIFQHVGVLWAKPGAAGFNQFACSGLNDEPNAVSSFQKSNANWTGKWFHVVCSYNSGVYRLYVNGELEGQSSSPTTWSPPLSGAYQGYIGWVDKVGLWWKGQIDNVGYYKTALSTDTVGWHSQTGNVDDTDFHPSFITTSPEDVAPPSQSRIDWPANFAQFSLDARSFKVQDLDFTCVDVVGAGTGSGISSCTATVDGNPINDGDPLPLTVGQHSVTITATDLGGNVYTHAHRYYVHATGNGFRDLIKCTVPVFVPAFTCNTGPEAYFRLDEPANALVMNDSSGNAHHGEFKNDANGTATGISGGNSNASRRFFGVGGYAYANGITEPAWGYTMELFVKPAFSTDMMLMQHGGSGALYIKNHKVVFRPEERSPVTLTASNVTIAANSWYYVAATYDGVTARLHVIRSPQTLTAVSLPPSFASTDGSVVDDWERISSKAVHYQPNGSDTFYLGYGDQLGGNGWLRGDLDEAAYYAKVLSSSKLSEHYYADPPSKLGKKAKAKAKVKAKAKAKHKAKHKKH
jgi:hypothetical protein